MVSTRTKRLVAPLVVALVCAGVTIGLTLHAVARRSGGAGAAPTYTAMLPPDQPKPLTLRPNPRVLLIGDSYAEGWGADPLSAGFAYHIAQPLGWHMIRDGIGATSYVDPGPKKLGTYPTRLARHKPRDSFDLVILQGGTNDEKLSPEAITAGVDAAVHVVRERYPSAQLLIMGPVAPFGDPSEARLKFNLALAEYTHEHSILYINPIAEHWFQPGEWRTLVNPDKAFPNNAGYARMTQRFVQDIHDLSRAGS